jgi:superfamily II DNA or RNA helicase
LETRASGHPDAGGLIAAMNQEHARFVAQLLEERTGVRAELVVSDLDDASKRITAFAKSKAPWIVAVHMISEGVDIPRLRVGVFASNVVSELYFRQFCGRFVRTGADPRAQREAYVYVPDDARLRAMAGAITDDVRRALRGRNERDEVADALRAAQREERVADEGEYASIAATARAGNVLDFGPLFNPNAYYAKAAEEHAAAAPANVEEEPEVVTTHAERREDLRRSLRLLVSRASTTFSVDHKLVHATLNQRFGGPVATATLAGLEARRRLIEAWLERRVYDGMR